MYKKYLLLILVVFMLVVVSNTSSAGNCCCTTTYGLPKCVNNKATWDGYNSCEAWAASVACPSFYCSSSDCQTCSSEVEYKTCYIGSCSGSQERVCNNGNFGPWSECIKNDPCCGVNCASGETCKDGSCVKTCNAGYICKDSSTRAYQYTDCSYGATEYCSNGCQDGYCKQATCTSHYTKKCYNNDVYYYDSCGNRETIYQDCQYGCSNGQCISASASAPTLASPSNNAIITTTTPTLKWNSVSGATWYCAFLYENYVHLNTYCTASTSYAVSDGTLSYNHTYQWRVKAQNSVGWSNLSSYYIFTINQNNQISAEISLSSPVNGETVEITPTLIWVNNPSIVSYMIKIYTDSAGSNAIYISSLITENSLIIPKDVIENGKTYYWQVFGKTASDVGVGTFSAKSLIWKFTVVVPTYVEGYVTDDQGTKLSGATVQVLKNGNVINSSSTYKGYYKMYVAPGVYNMKAFKSSGYLDQTISNKEINGPTQVDFRLTRTGSISGTVRDFFSRQPISGVTVSAYLENKVGTWTANTDSSGFYKISNVVPNTYSVKAEKQGYFTQVNTNNALNAGENMVVNFDMFEDTNNKNNTMDNTTNIIKMCSDGTPYGECSNIKIGEYVEQTGKYCNNGTLIDNCVLCGGCNTCLGTICNSCNGNGVCEENESADCQDCSPPPTPVCGDDICDQTECTTCVNDCDNKSEIMTENTLHEGDDEVAACFRNTFGYKLIGGAIDVLGNIFIPEHNNGEIDWIGTVTTYTCAVSARTASWACPATEGGGCLLYALCVPAALWSAKDFLRCINKYDSQYQKWEIYDATKEEYAKNSVGEVNAGPASKVGYSTQSGSIKPIQYARYESNYTCSLNEYIGCTNCLKTGINDIYCLDSCPVVEFKDPCLCYGDCGNTGLGLPIYECNPSVYTSSFNSSTDSDGFIKTYFSDYCKDGNNAGAVSYKLFADSDAVSVKKNNITYSSVDFSPTNEKRCFAIKNICDQYYTYNCIEIGKIENGYYKINDANNSNYWFIYDTIIDAYGFLRDNSYIPGKVEIEWPWDGEFKDAVPYGDGTRINLQNGKETNPSTILYEYGIAIFQQFGIDYNGTSRYSFYYPELGLPSEETAFKEGWAWFISKVILAEHDGAYKGYYESNVNYNDPQRTPKAIAQILWDIYDVPFNDDDDIQSQSGMRMILTVLKEDKPKDIMQFYKKFTDRYGYKEALKKIYSQNRIDISEQTSETSVSYDVDQNNKIDIYDIVKIAKIFNAKINNDNFDSNADLNNDGKIDIYDLTIIGKNFGKGEK